LFDKLSIDELASGSGVSPVVQMMEFGREERLCCIDDELVKFWGNINGREKKFI
jgi:hypothetical protein